MSRAQERARQHSAVVAQVGRILAEQIDAAVKSTVEDGQLISAGLLPDDDALTLETFSQETSVLTMNLAADIIILPDSGDAAVGRTLTTVAQNINAQKRYRFLFPGRLDIDWRELVIRMRNILSQQCSPDAINKFCQYRIIDMAIFSGICIYRLDIESMIMQRPSFFEIIRDVTG